MKPGELMRIVPREQQWSLDPGEPEHCVFLVRECLLEEWGDQVAGECDCLVLWKGEIVPFNSEDLVPVEDE